MNCAHRGAGGFKTPSGHAGHQKTCARKRAWERAHFLATGTWPTRSKFRRASYETSGGTGRTARQAIAISRAAVPSLKLGGL